MVWEMMELTIQSAMGASKTAPQTLAASDGLTDTYKHKSKSVKAPWADGLRMGLQSLKRQKLPQTARQGPAQLIVIQTPVKPPRDTVEPINPFTTGQGIGREWGVQRLKARELPEATRQRSAKMIEMKPPMEPSKGYQGT